MSESQQTEPAESPAVRVSRNGPYQVSGDVVLHDTNGEVIPTEGHIWLCRCGESQDKPFCDGSHKRIEFKDPGTFPLE